jgi:hypothetical protein
MIDVKQAVEAATAYARELFRDEELRHLRVEEVELSSDQRVWNITLGWVEPAVRQDTGSLLIRSGTAELQRLPRVYKVFRVEAETGAVHGMKMREVA